MDATREHLWGQLLLERNLLGRDDLVRVAQERDAAIQRGQDVSVGQLLVQQRRLDPGLFAQMSQDIEGRGRACPACRRVFFAATFGEPTSCPQCGGPAGLRPAGGPSGMTGRFQVPAHLQSSTSGRLVPGSDRFPGGSAWGAAAPAGSGQFTAAGAYPSVTAALSGSMRSIPPPAMSGSMRAVPPPAYAQAPNGYGQPAGYPAPGYAPTGYAPTGGYVPPSGSFAPVPPPSGRFAAVANDFDPMGGGFGGPAQSSPPHGLANGPVVPISTAAEASDDVSSGELGVGKRFGRYEIVQELGRGGMGVVYKVRVPGQQGFLAVKVLLAGEFASPKLMERFREEARLARKLRHPNIVAVHDVGEVDGIPYYAMDFIEGSELQELIRGKNLPLRRGVEILAEVCRAAHYAHENGVVHRDLKPSNILVSAGGQSYIMDFGLAKNLDDDKGLTRSGVAIGTPYYMPPEQARGSHREMDARSDVYALGAILYEILTRRVPFTAKTQNELLRKIVEEEPQPPRLVKAGVPAELDVVALKAIRKEKNDRYESALSMAEDLERWLRGEKIVARHEAPWAPLLRRARRNKTTTAIVAAAGVVVAVSGAVIAVIVRQHQAEAEQVAADQAAAAQKRLEDEKKKTAAEEKQKAESAALQKRRDDAAAQVRAGLEASLSAKTASSPDESMTALRRAAEAFGRAQVLERELGEKRQATAYRRGLVRRSLCQWEGARQDLQQAAKDPAFQARAGLALGVLILRVDADPLGAEQAFKQASAAARAAADDKTHTAEAREEEQVAEQIARAYGKYLAGDEPMARRNLQDLVSGGSGGSMVAEACAALAFFARQQGSPLGGDDHVQRGLLKADQAVRADGYRYDVLCDRALLRARAGRAEDALSDLRTARALHADGEWPELAEATVCARKRDLNKMRQLLEGAQRKVVGRSRRAVDDVNAFCERLQRAVEGNTTLPPVDPTTDRPDRVDPPDQPPKIERDTKAPLDIPANAGPKMPQPFQLVVGDDVEAVRIAVRGVWIDMAIAARHGAFPSDQAPAEHVTSEVDPTLVIRRPELRTGTYGVLLVPSRAPGALQKGTLSVQLFKRGQKAPYPWRAARDLPKISPPDQLSEAENRSLQTALQARERDDLPTALEAWSRVATAHPELPELKLIEIDMLFTSGRPDEALPMALELADKKLPRDARALNLAMAACWALDENEKALGYAKRLAELDPDFFDAHMLPATCHLQDGKYKEAEAALDKLLARDPDHEQAQLMRLVAQLAQGKSAATDSIARTAVSPECTVTNRMLAVQGLIEHGQGQRALELCDTLTRLAGRPTLQIDLQRARALGKVGRKQEGLDLLRRIRASVKDEKRAIDLVDKLIREVEGGEAPKPDSSKPAPRNTPRR